MFTPTDLLRLYLKEAFNREGIAAPDEKISTWSRFQIDLARHRFRILKTSASNGPFVLNDRVALLDESAVLRPTEWYEEFRAWHMETFWSELREAAEALASSNEIEVSRLGKSLIETLTEVATGSFASRFLEISRVSSVVDKIVAGKKLETDNSIRKTLALQINRDRAFLEKFSSFLENVGATEEELDDQDDEDDDDAQTPRTRIAAAATAYMSNIRSQARARFGKRNLGKGANWQNRRLDR
jgi:hypothetical protein